jgi:4-hydroxy-tetrahydrodipicolinate synthase
MSTEPAWHGIFPYLVSPVDRDGRVSTGVLARLVEHLVGHGVHGLSPLGSTGEFPYLTAPQRIEVVRAVVEAARGRVPVVPGVAAYSTHDAIDQIRRVLDAGANGVILILQTYFPLAPEGVASFFETVAAAVPCPICVYTNPRLLGFDLTPGQIVALSQIPNIRYVKDASGETGRLLTILNRTEGRIAVFSASAHVPLLVFRLGGVGWMAGPACLIPDASVRLYDLARSGRWEDAERLQRRLWPVNEVFQRHGLAACVKAGLRLQGFEAGDPIPPQRPLGRAAIEEIRQALEEAGR